MSEARDEPEETGEPEVVGVPPGTPPAVEPSVTGVVAGPLDEEPEVDVVDVDAEGGRTEPPPT